MAFSEEQVKQLSGKLSGKHVKTRVRDGFTLSYIEGWHVISEANRIFGFDAWDRETVMAECVWERTQGRHSACSYVARVRITVRSGDTVICREGSGSGNGTGKNPGEAHERALKEAETDAMKRAMTTFGNLFGLALYDKEKNGVRRSRSMANKKPVVWTVHDGTGKPQGSYDDPVVFCATIREQLERIDEASNLMAFWTRNQLIVEELRKSLPELMTEKGRHYGELLQALYTSRLDKVKTRKCTESPRPNAKSVNAEVRNPKVGKENGPKVDTPNSTSKEGTLGTLLPLEKGPRRIRDKDHLKMVASQNCLICGRKPSQAHHILYAQPRAFGRKVSDEWTVPLCAIHHRALHDCGNEEKWWGQQKIDPIDEAKRFWYLGHQQRESG